MEKRLELQSILMTEDAPRMLQLLENQDYQLHLERKVDEQTQLLQQKERELKAVNNLFVKYLNQGFEAAETYSRLASVIMNAAEEIQSLAREAEASRVRYFRTEKGQDGQ